MASTGCQVNDRSAARENQDRLPDFCKCGGRAPPGSRFPACRSRAGAEGRPGYALVARGPGATRAMSGKPASDHTTHCGQSPEPPLDKGASKARLRVFVCNSCSTSEVVTWCGQNPDCGHPECTEALAECAAAHRVDDRCFHGQVNVAIVERHLWDRYMETAADEACRRWPAA